MALGTEKVGSHGQHQIWLPGSLQGFDSAKDERDDPLPPVPPPPREDWLVPAEPFEASLSHKLVGLREASQPQSGSTIPAKQLGHHGGVSSLPSLSDVLAPADPQKQPLKTPATAQAKPAVQLDANCTGQPSMADPAPVHDTPFRLHANATSQRSPAGDLPSTSGRPHLAPQDPRPHKLRVHVVTFNMNSKTPTLLPSSLLCSAQANADKPASILSTASQRSMKATDSNIKAVSWAASAVADEAFRPPQHDCDLYAIGTQESGSIKEWEALLQQTLTDAFVKLSSASLMAIHLVVFVRRELLPSICGVRTSVMATGVGNMLGNKGGVAVGFTYCSTSLLFISSHFAAHEHKVAQRNSDFHRIKAGLFAKRAGSTNLDSSQHNIGMPATAPRMPSLSMLDRVSSVQSEDSSLTGSDSSFSVAGGADSPQTPSKLRLRSQVATWGHSVTDEFDVTIWMGDFNYRVEGNRRIVDLAMREQMWEVLRHNDQLRREKAKGRVFKGFEEGSLDFPPTYKFDPGTDTYDTSAKMRTPSWTDRILWKCNPATWPEAIRLLHYSHVPAVKFSDHRPVAAVLEVQTRSQTEGQAEQPSFLMQSLRRMQVLRCMLQ